MTRSIAADLERRGYIVFIVVQSTEEQQVVEAENRSDIRALYIDIAEVCSLLTLPALLTDNISEEPPHSLGDTPLVAGHLLAHHATSTSLSGNSASCMPT